MSSNYTEILDDNIEPVNQAKGWRGKLVVLFILTFLYLFLAEYFRAALPDRLFYFFDIEVRFSSIGFLIILFLNAYFAPAFFNQGLPTWSLVSIASLSGLLFFGAILIKVLTYNYIVHSTGIRMNYGYIFYTSAVLGVLACFTANIRIRKIRGHKTIPAWILLFIVWYGLTIIAM